MTTAGIIPPTRIPTQRCGGENRFPTRCTSAISNISSPQEERISPLPPADEQTAHLPCLACLKKQPECVGVNPILFRELLPPLDGSRDWLQIPGYADDGLSSRR